MVYLLLRKSMPSYLPHSPSMFIRALSHLRMVMRWKSQGVTVISLLAMWKVWVVSHHFLAKVYTRMALANLSSSKQIIDSKPTAQMWALVYAGTWCMYVGSKQHTHEQVCVRIMLGRARINASHVRRLESAYT